MRLSGDHKRASAWIVISNRRIETALLFGLVLLAIGLAMTAPAVAQSGATDEPTASATSEVTETELATTPDPSASETPGETPTVGETVEPTPTDLATVEVEPAPTIPAETPLSPAEDNPELSAASIVPIPNSLFLPVLDNRRQNSGVSPETVLLCSNNRLDIPDDRSSGVRDFISSQDARFIHEMAIYVNIEHAWTGDLTVDLTHVESGLSLRLVDRPGVPYSSLGCPGDNLISILDDRANQPLENKCASQVVPAIAGTYRPMQALSTLKGRLMSGTWELKVADESPYDTGRLVSWCMEASLSPTLPPVQEPTQPLALPSSARIYNISGQNQSMPLSCESRSAVDWAGYFGVYIGEYDFFNRLPKSDNPDAGFVGNVYGTWGQIPPNPYGVHAEPVAELLRDYGLNAYAHKRLVWDDVRAEVAAGRPVETWIVGAADLVYSAYPVFYTAQDGHTSVVSRYEHTVLVIGYSPSEVVLLNGGSVITRPLDTFLDSWSMLRNMAVTTRAEPATASVAMAGE